MPAAYIATTRSQDLQALATAGQSALDAWNTLHALLARELSPEHAALLAEPVANPARGETDWYSAAEGPAVPLRAFPPEQRAAAQSMLDNQVAAIEALADRLRAGRSDSDRVFGGLLGLTLRIPGEDSIYVQNGRPILVAWGHVRSGQEASSVTLTGRRAVPQGPMRIVPPPPPALLAVPRQSARWPLGLLLAGLLASLFVLFLLTRDTFGWFAVTAPVCRIAHQDIALLATLRDEAARGAVLRSMLADVTEDGGRNRQMCAPQPPAPSPQSAPSSDARRAAERGARGGKLQILLAWDDRNDLDLHVVCPDGSEISFLHKAGCGGRLDVDANGPGTSQTATPVENVSFVNPTPGHYKVIVDPYEQSGYEGMRVANESQFRITIRRDGMPDQVVTGVARKGQRAQQVTDVEVGTP